MDKAIQQEIDAGTISGNDTVTVAMLKRWLSASQAADSAPKAQPDSAPAP